MVIMQLVMHNGFIIVYLENKIVISFSSNKILSYIFFPSMCTDNVYMSLELMREILYN